MGGLKKTLFRDHYSSDHQSLEDLAERLGGEVSGRYIQCPSPGYPPDDRSCCIAINPERPDDFAVIECEGKEWKARSEIKAALGIGSDNAKNRARAVRIWGSSLSAQRTIVERYLRSRGIALPIPSAIRYVPNLWHSKDYSGPAMVAPITDLNGALIALHQTWLAPDGRAKAAIKNPKMFLAKVGGGAVRLAPVGEQIALAEGIETALSFTQASGIGTWSVMSANGLWKADLPSIINRVVIAADGEKRGQASAFAAAHRFRKQGRAVEIYYAPKGKDFNDLLQERMA